MLRAPEFINDPMAYFDRDEHVWKTRDGASDELRQKVTKRNEQERACMEYAREHGILA